LIKVNAGVIFTNIQVEKFRYSEFQ